MNGRTCGTSTWLNLVRDKSEEKKMALSTSGYPPSFDIHLLAYQIITPVYLSLSPLLFISVIRFVSVLIRYLFFSLFLSAHHLILFTPQHVSRNSSNNSHTNTKTAYMAYDCIHQHSKTTMLSTAIRILHSHCRYYIITTYTQNA